MGKQGWGSEIQFLCFFDVHAIQQGTNEVGDMSP